ncbi:MAG: RNA polymerase sigma factor [Desulfobulbaceae bacterium]|nr:RNA polymerase sigma factor [Desulfobulbaceae bacterium]
MEISNEEIISQVLDGRKQAYSILITRYQRQIFNLMYRYSRSENDAADLTQEVFIRAYEKLNSFSSGHSFFTWLYTLAVNRANDWSRKRNRQQQNHIHLAHQLSNHQERETRQEKLLENKEDLQRLQRAINMLSDDTREILMLRFHEEIPVKEVAQIFSISESAVKMRTARGLQQLQGIMQEDDS